MASSRGLLIERIVDRNLGSAPDILGELFIFFFFENTDERRFNMTVELYANMKLENQDTALITRVNGQEFTVNSSLIRHPLKLFREKPYL